MGYATELLSIDAVSRMFEEGRLTVSVPDGAWVTLDGLGRFQAGAGQWWTDPRERIREAYDLLTQLQGGPSAMGLCLQARRAFEAAPSEDRREALRAAYAAVPRHLRRFLGERPIRRILGEPVEEEAPDTEQDLDQTDGEAPGE